MVSVMTSLSMSMSPSRQPGPASQPGLASPVPGTVVVVLGTGGTIAGQAEDAARALRYASARHGVAWLLGAVPALARFALEAEQVAQVDSRNMEMAVLARLVGRVAHHLGRPEVAGVVITHGTDTLEETAWLLHRVLQPARPVVLTAAMRPANALGADGPLNLHDAVAVAAGAPEQPVRAGVWLAFDGRVWPGWAVRKVHSWRPPGFRRRRRAACRRTRGRARALVRPAVAGRSVGPALGPSRLGASGAGAARLAGRGRGLALGRDRGQSRLRQWPRRRCAGGCRRPRPGRGRHRPRQLARLDAPGAPTGGRRGYRPAAGHPLRRGWHRRRRSGRPGSVRRAPHAGAGTHRAGVALDGKARGGFALGQARPACASRVAGRRRRAETGFSPPPAASPPASATRASAPPASPPRRRCGSAGGRGRRWHWGVACRWTGRTRLRRARRQAVRAACRSG